MNKIIVDKKQFKNIKKKNYSHNNLLVNFNNNNELTNFIHISTSPTIITNILTNKGVLS